jgi:hypothetical protein
MRDRYFLYFPTCKQFLERPIDYIMLSMTDNVLYRHMVLGLRMLVQLVMKK